MEFDIGNLFIGELLVTSENRTLDFSNSGIFVDGRQWRIYIVKFWMRAPRGSKFFQFHAVFWEILAKSYVGAHPGELAPPPRGNPRSATGRNKEKRIGKLKMN